MVRCTARHLVTKVRSHTPSHVCLNMLGRRQRVFASSLLAQGRNILLCGSIGVFEKYNKAGLLFWTVGLKRTQDT